MNKMTDDISSCNNQIANCGPNEMSINGNCVPFTVTSKYTGTYTEYSVGTEDQDWPIIDQTGSDDQYGCIQKCNGVDKCGAVRFNYNTGSCHLLNTNATPAAILDHSNDESKCIGLFVKDNIHTGPKNCNTPTPDSDCQNMSIMIKPDQIVNIDMSSAKSAKTIQRIQSDWQGAACRELAADGKIPPDDQDILNGMGQFCKNNPDFKVCKQFCSNNTYTDFCHTKSSTIMMLIFIALMFTFILIFILVRIKRKRILSYIFGGLSGVSVALTIWQVIEYIRSKGGQYDGTKPDYPMSGGAPSSKYCVDNNYACSKRTNPRGQRCVPVPPGETGSDRVTCESTCCPPGFSSNPKDGRCYQNKPEGNITFYSSMHHKCSCHYGDAIPCNTTCPDGYTPLNGHKWPQCTADRKAYQGDMYCTGVEYPTYTTCHDNPIAITKYPHWEECTSAECTPGNIVVRAWEPGDGGYAPAVFCPPPPS